MSTDAVRAALDAHDAEDAQAAADNTAAVERLNVQLQAAQDATLAAQRAQAIAEQALADYKLSHPDAPPPPPPPPKSLARLGYWDQFPLRVGGSTTSTVKATNYNANAGVSAAMKAAGGRGSQIMHTYPGAWETNYATSSVAKSAEFGHAFLNNQSSPGDAYSNAGYADVAAGKYDAQIAAWFNSQPTSEVGYSCIDSEPENHGVDPVAWAKAVAHIVNVAAPIMKARGLRGGVGGLLMGYTFSQTGQKPPPDPVAAFKKWDWLQYVDASALPYAVYMMDVYSKYLDATASTYESIPGTCELAFTQARARGCTRFGIGEFANSRAWRLHSDQIVGSSATQQAWIKAEIPKIVAIDGLELAIMFAKPTGPESKFGELVDDATAKPFTEYAKVI